MWLAQLAIRNYRSLQDVSIDHLDQFNVLIGRNNSGKTSVFNVLRLVGQILRGESVDVSTVLPFQNAALRLGVDLVSSPSDGDRERLIQMLMQSGQATGRDVALRGSSFGRRLEFKFESPAGGPSLLHLRQVRMLVEGNEWATIQRLENPADEITNAPVHLHADLATMASRAPNGPLGTQVLDLNFAQPLRNGAAPNLVAYLNPLNPPSRWAIELLINYLGSAFFFTPFRHSEPLRPVQQVGQLSQDGSNLAQRLKTIEGEDRETLERIESFVHTAVPELGPIQLPLVGNQTEVTFRAAAAPYRIRLHEMGGGIEQVTMLGLVLLTTPEEDALFLEEPESHLHPGTQRFLIDRLAGTRRQVFVSTHSSVFLNVNKLRRIYRVDLNAGSSIITPVSGPDSLDRTLQDVGIRNSDVLLSDSILFVEGSGDRDAMQAISETLGISLAEHNVTIAAMGGGEHADRTAPVRSDVLTAVSTKSPIPHTFLLDRDERSSEQLERLIEMLGERVRLLERRELENYLLVPDAIRAALLEKYRDSPSIIEAVDKLSPTDMDEMIRRSAERLAGLVTLKRIRSELGGLPEGFLPRAVLDQLSPSVFEAGFAERLADELGERAKAVITAADIATKAARAIAEVSHEWTNEEARLVLAPGEEILQGIFEEVGGRYEKPADTARLARHLTPAQVAPELKAIIHRIVALASGV